MHLKTGLHQHSGEQKWVEITILGVAPLKESLHQGVVGDGFVEKPLMSGEK